MVWQQLADLKPVLIRLLALDVLLVDWRPVAVLAETHGFVHPRLLLVRFDVAVVRLDAQLGVLVALVLNDMVLVRFVYSHVSQVVAALLAMRPWASFIGYPFDQFVLLSHHLPSLLFVSNEIEWVISLRGGPALVSGAVQLEMDLGGHDSRADIPQRRVRVLGLIRLDPFICKDSDSDGLAVGCDCAPRKDLSASRVPLAANLPQLRRHFDGHQLGLQVRLLELGLAAIHFGVD